VRNRCVDVLAVDAADVIGLVDGGVAESAHIGR
jgi:hypothetical protein